MSEAIQQTTTQRKTVELNDPQLEVFNSTASFNLALFGNGTGKTHCMGIISGDFICRFPQIHMFVGANTHMQLTQSTMKRVLQVWDDIYGFTEYDAKDNPDGQYIIGKKPPRHFNTEGHYFSSYNGVISFVWGAVVYVGSLENYKVHDGKEFMVALLDETKDTREEAVKEVIIGRLRMFGIYVKNGIICDDPTGEPFTPMYVFTTPAKVPWLNEFFNLEQFHDEIIEQAKADGDYFNEMTRHNMRVVVASTHHNQKNLPSNYIENRTTGLSEAEIDMLIYAIPFAKTGGEAFVDFKIGRNASDNSDIYDPTRPLFLTWDFNVVPYMSVKPLQVFQDQYEEWKGEPVWNVYALPEIATTSPNNTTYGACREVLRRFPDHKGRIIIHGDRTAKKRSTRDKDGQNDFDIIVAELSTKYPNVEVNLPGKNPNGASRISFMNSIFRQQIDIRYFEDKNSKYSMRDWSYTKLAPDGSKLKEKTKDKDTGVTYEKYGHMSDATEYFFCRHFREQYRRHIGKSKMTVSR